MPDTCRLGKGAEGCTQAAGTHRSESFSMFLEAFPGRGSVSSIGQ